jgi:hypothetical protein
MIYKMTEWTKLVQKIYNENKSKPGYKLGDAMKDAKKVYKKDAVEPKNKSNKNKKGKK